MPVFDDPRKNLHRLQQELLAEEETYEEELSEEDWLDQELAEAKALSGYEEQPQVPVRNFANGYGAAPQPRNYGEGQPRTYMSGYSTYQQARPAYREQPQYEDEEIPEEKGIRSLVALAVLLTLGIVAVAAYWVLVLL